MAMISSLAFANQHDALLSDHLLHLRTDMMLRDQISVVVAAVVVAGDDDDDDDDDDDEICLLLMVMMVMTIMGGRSDARVGARSERLALIYGYVAIRCDKYFGKLGLKASPRCYLEPVWIATQSHDVPKHERAQALWSASSNFHMFRFSRMNRPITGNKFKS